MEVELSAISLTFQTATEEQIIQANQSLKNKLLGVSYLMCVDLRRFENLLEDIENAYLVASDQFPDSMNYASHCVTNWINDPR